MTNLVGPVSLGPMQEKANKQTKKQTKALWDVTQKREAALPPRLRRGEGVSLDLAGLSGLSVRIPNPGGRRGAELRDSQPECREHNHGPWIQLCLKPHVLIFSKQG